MGLRFERPARKKIDQNCNIFDFSRHLHGQLIERCRENRKYDKLKYEIKISPNWLILETKKTNIKSVIFISTLFIKKNELFKKNALNRNANK